MRTFERDFVRHTSLTCKTINGFLARGLFALPAGGQRGFSPDFFVGVCVATGRTDSTVESCTRIAHGPRNLVDHGLTRRALRGGTKHNA
jgi:hypothetical protein